jgi:hypothetical protein
MTCTEVRDHQIENLVAIQPPTPKYELGTTVYVPYVKDGYAEAECPDCKGTKVWHVKTGSGLEFETPCQRCDKSYGMPGYRERALEPAFRETTIQRIRIEWGESKDKHTPEQQVRYIFDAYANGGYGEDDLCVTQAEALAAASKQMEGPYYRRDERRQQDEEYARSLKGVNLRTAFEIEAVKNFKEMKAKYDAAVEAIIELKDDHISGLIRHSFDSGRQECIARHLLERIDEPVPDDWGEY